MFLPFSQTYPATVIPSPRLSFFSSVVNVSVSGESPFIFGNESASDVGVIDGGGGQIFGIGILPTGRGFRTTSTTSEID